MGTLHETHDQIISRVTDEQRVLHGGVSDGVEHLGRKELEAAALALGVGVVVALAVGVPQHWSVVMSVFIGFTAAIGTFVVASIISVESDDGRVNEQAHGEAQRPSRWRVHRTPRTARAGEGRSTHAMPSPMGAQAHSGASADAISHWIDDGGSTLDDLG